MRRVLLAIYAFILLFLCSPLLVLCAVIIVVTSGRPILFTQQRIGKRGKLFSIYKFRTMVVDSEKMKKSLRSKNEADGPVFKIHDDPRFTPIGKFLSHTGIDELPQLFNIIKGEMGFFGPRPLPVEEAKKLTSYQQKRENITPGIISPWIINGYHTNKFDEWMDSDITYIKEKSLSTDLQLLIKTIRLVSHLVIREIKNRLRPNSLSR